MRKKKGERECYLPMTEMSIRLGGWVGDEVLEGCWWFWSMRLSRRETLLNLF